jgi:deoxyribodipyrimidine photo-lyase
VLGLYVLDEVLWRTAYLVDALAALDARTRPVRAVVPADAWATGAAHFMARLVDGDVAQNQLNWQWVAGSGYDAAPFFRVFNPVTQGTKSDPDGEYVRRWVPELRGVDGPRVHEPWRLDPPPPGYPAPVVDHARERRVALDAFARARH